MRPKRIPMVTRSHSPGHAGAGILAAVFATDAQPTQVVLDQIAAIKSCIRIAVPINIVLGIVNLVVACQSGLALRGTLWFVASFGVNLARLAMARMPAPRIGALAAHYPRLSEVNWQRRLIWLGAVVSGLIWAGVPLLCAGFTAPQSLFFLTVVCGVTAGAVTHGAPDARTALGFLLPTLISVGVAMLVAGGFYRYCIAVTVLIYIAALVRSSIRAEQAFCHLSRMTNEATANASSLARAHARSLDMIDVAQHRAAHDDLTGLLNRAGFLAEVEGCIARHETAACLMFVDLDGFKAVNDVYGHRKGDHVLIEIARRLRTHLEPPARLARMGGDEFAVFAPIAAGADAGQIAQGIIAAVSVPIEGVETGTLGASIGVYVNPRGDISDMLACADEALYAAKSAGRNRFHIFDEALHQRLQVRRDLERDLLRHLEEGHLDVWFQPIYATGRTMPDTLEALLRWRHPQHGWVRVEDVITLAAVNGHAEPLLRFVLARVCRALIKMESLGIAGVKVAMNISPREMMQLPVDTIILTHLEVLGIDPRLLDVEVTEETALDIQLVQDKMLTLAQAGVTISLDDFGVGYSSLDTVRHGRVQRIKIDRSFVSNITQSIPDQYLVGTIINLGRVLGIDVVVEGIETAQDHAMIRALGGSLMQGYFLHKPMPEREVLDLLAGLAGVAGPAMAM